MIRGLRAGLISTGAAVLLALLSGGAGAAEHLRCGVITEPLDWNKQDLHGSLVPLDTELCRAVATALFGSPDRLELQAYNTEQEGLAALSEGKSDIVAGVTPAAGPTAKAGMHFSPPIFQDGQGFMVHRAEGINSIADIEGHKLCYIEDTDNDPTVLAFLAARGVRPIPFGFQEEGEMDAGIMDRHCQVTSALLSKLAEARATFRNAADYVFLPDMLTLVPVAIAVPGDAHRLSGIVDYTVSVLLQAEFLGVTRKSAQAASHSDDPRMRRLSGEDWITAQGLDLPHDWSRSVIAAVRNYAESYDRTVGLHAFLHLPRGLNALWNQGGRMAPLPLQ